jgi:hypothetical protein
MGRHRASLQGSGLGLLLTALLGPPTALAAGAPSTPILSGLAWRSGSTQDGFPCLADLRGRTLDVLINFVTHKSFAAMVNQTGGALAGGATQAPLWVVSLPLLTDDTAGQFAQCAAGAFDVSWRQIGTNLQKAGAQGTVVRLGWEANTGSGSHAWGVDGSAQVGDYVACWRHAAAQLKSTAPGLSLEWTNAKKGVEPFNVLDMYPGDDVVDLWGVHYYDSGPQMSTQAIWDQAYTRTNNGGPWGLGTWLDAAVQHGKKLAVSEYGIWQQSDQTAAAADDPVYIDNMYRFFRNNAPSVAYESYFDSMSVHQLCPGTLFPNATAKYQADWRSGS